MAYHILKATSPKSVAKKHPQHLQSSSVVTLLKMDALQHVQEPRDVDVLLGRGKSNLHHPGNKYFQQLIRSNRDRYFHTSSTNESKRVIIEEIVDILQRSGRLCLKPVGNSSNIKNWVQLSGEAMRQKIAHALQYRQRCSAAHVNKAGERMNKITKKTIVSVRRNKNTAQQSAIPSNETLNKQEKELEQPPKSCPDDVSEADVDIEDAMDLIQLSECELLDQWFQSCVNDNADYDIVDDELIAATCDDDTTQLHDTFCRDETTVVKSSDVEQSGDQPPQLSLPPPQLARNTSATSSSKGSSHCRRRSSSSSVCWATSSSLSLSSCCGGGNIIGDWNTTIEPIPLREVLLMNDQSSSMVNWDIKLFRRSWLQQTAL